MRTPTGRPINVSLCQAVSLRVKDNQGDECYIKSSDITHVEGNDSGGTDIKCGTATYHSTHPVLDVLKSIHWEVVS